MVIKKYNEICNRKLTGEVNVMVDANDDDSQPLINTLDIQDELDIMVS